MIADARDAPLLITNSLVFFNLLEKRFSSFVQDAERHRL